jgi:hypothetical protein
MNFEDIYKQALQEDEGAANTSTTGGSSSIAAVAPENPIKIKEDEPVHTVEVYNGDKQIDLKETTLRRIHLRQMLNEQLFESINNKTINKDIDNIESLKEAVFDAAKSWILYEKEENKGRNSPRYALQKWTNGGGGDGTEKGQPSAYEAWRGAIVDKRRKARLEQEHQDETNPFKSPTTTDVSAHTLDNQEDQFLDWYISKHGGKK